MTERPTGTLHLITGGTGAGKTHHAIALCEKQNVHPAAVRFSIDDWMTALFWMDSPTPIQHQWALDRIARCEAVIWDTASALLQQGIDVVFDLGFTKQAHRADYAAKAGAIGANIILHWIDITADRRWANVQHRNATRGPSWAMDVDRAMFDFMENQYEAPDADEMAALNGVRITAQGQGTGSRP